MTLTNSTTFTRVTRSNGVPNSLSVNSVLMFVEGRAERTASGRMQSLQRTFSMTHIAVTVVTTRTIREPTALRNIRVALVKSLCIAEGILSRATV